MFRVLVIAGTVDARHIIEELIKCGAYVTATVTTPLGKSLLDRYDGVDAREGRLTLKGMTELMGEIGARCLVDASHPFARDASVNAMEACKRLSIPYLRYERPETAAGGEGVTRVRDFEEAAESLKDFEGNIFLAIGSGKLQFFTRIADFKSRVFIRVLPDSKVLDKCERLGFDAGNILALKGPFSETMNLEMLKHCSASVMVTKDSGSAGGNEEKINAARKLGIPVIMIERPGLDYGCEVSTVKEAVAFVKKMMNRGSGA